MSTEQERLMSRSEPLPQQLKNGQDETESSANSDHSTIGDGTNGANRSNSSVEAEGSVPDSTEGSHSAGSQSDVDIPDETKKWVEEQIPKWKTGVAIMGRAKNNSRKDQETVKRYVEQLVAGGEIPMSGRKLPSGKKKGVVPHPVSISAQDTAVKRTESVEVLISEIHMNAQIRAQNLNELNVVRLMENFDTTDPVDLFRRPEGELELANGYHRVESAKRLNKKTIRAYIHEGTMCDALVFAYKTNDRNGIPLTKADRINALIMIKKTPEGSKLTGDQLADQLGVSRQTIQTYLAEIRDGKQDGAKKRGPKDEAALQKKAVATLSRIEDRFGLTVFRDFVQSLGDDKRAKLRAMMD